MQNIIGNQNAKWSIEVALAGCHDFVLLDTINSNAKELLEAAKEIAKQAGLECKGELISLCPCKAYGNPLHECSCTVQKIQKHLYKIKDKVAKSEILIETCEPCKWETVENNESDSYLIDRLKSYDTTKQLEDNEEDLLGEEFNNRINEIDKNNIVKKVARTIANMDKSNSIKAQHLANAFSLKFNSISTIVDNICK
jgi:predicted ATPase with chaperone activity